MKWLVSMLLLQACGKPEEKPAKHEEPAPPTVDTAEPSDTSDPGPTPPAPGNVLIVIADDVGVDKYAAFGEHADTPSTPVVDALAAEGVLFRNAYASPMCSPTRAHIVTGRYSRRNGIGHLVNPSDEFELRAAELGIAEMLDYSPHPWATSMIGKWHLGSSYLGRDVAAHPTGFGWDWFAGSPNNLDVTMGGLTGELSYDYWEKNTNGVLGAAEVYATRDTTDDAIARVQQMPEPWLAYVAYNSAHKPLHTAPDDLHGVEMSDTATLPEQYHSMIEAMDTELGRLLDAMDPEVRSRTTILFIGDNGSLNEGILPPWDPAREKGTIYEGGVNVPLIVSGPLVEQPGSESVAFVHAVDLFATVAEIAGVPLEGPDAPPTLGPLDGISLVPYLRDPTLPSIRRYGFAEAFRPNGFVPETKGRRTVRDLEWKFVRLANENQADVEELYRFEPGAFDEGVNLLADGVEALDAEELEAYDRLRAVLDEIEIDIGVPEP